MKTYLVCIDENRAIMVQADGFENRNYLLYFYAFADDCEPVDVALFKNWTSVIQLDLLKDPKANEKKGSLWSLMRKPH